MPARKAAAKPAKRTAPGKATAARPKKATAKAPAPAKAKPAAPPAPAPATTAPGGVCPRCGTSTFAPEQRTRVDGSRTVRYAILVCERGHTFAKPVSR